MKGVPFRRGFGVLMCCCFAGFVWICACFFSGKDSEACFCKGFETPSLRGLCCPLLERKTRVFILEFEIRLYVGSRFPIALKKIFYGHNSRGQALFVQINSRLSMLAKWHIPPIVLPRENLFTRNSQR